MFYDLILQQAPNILLSWAICDESFVIIAKRLYIDISQSASELYYVIFLLYVTEFI